MANLLTWHQSTATQCALADETGRIYAKLFQKHNCWWSFNYKEYVTLEQAKAAAESDCKTKRELAKNSTAELPWNA